MDKLIPIINKLQEVVGAVEGSTGIDLPQIVVVGSQSSGKSSVLENIVGKDFLPRGAGIVTRRPLILQLRNVPKSAADTKDEWGEFSHKPSEIFFDFTKIRDEIMRETERLTGKNKGISAEPIILKISSPHVLNLTLVDLPGITRVPVGDQPLDIEDQIRRIVLKYISNPNAIILAVTAANTDLANSDALQLAKLVDPEGKRTIGVLTKLDLMDKGTDALDILLGNTYPLRLGFIGVVNRSQQDIISDKPIHLALQHEARFFQSHPVYKKIAHKCGTAYLAQTLSKVLMSHIRACLPDLKARVSTLLQQAQMQLAQYGGDPLLNGNKSALLLQTLSRFAADYVASIDGKLTDMPEGELYGGARINWLFTEHFAGCLAKINPLDGLSPNDIRTAIRNATGPRTALFIPEAAFELLVKRQISRLREPCEQCVDLVYDELVRIVQQLGESGRGNLARFATLRDRVMDVATNMLAKCRQPTRDAIDALLRVEFAYINTSHPDFIKTDSAVSQLIAQLSDEKATQQLQQLQREQMIANSTPPLGHSPPTHSPQAMASSHGAHAAHAAQAPRGIQAAPNRVAPVRAMPTGRINPVHNDKADKEQFETELIQSLLVSYFTIVRKNMQDQIPKAIMHFLVNQSKNELQHELVATLYKEDLIDDLLAESPDIAAKRKHLQQTVEMLTRANAILNDVRDGVKL